MKNSRTAYVILGMLSLAPKGSGYELHKAIEENFGRLDSFSMTFGSVLWNVAMIAGMMPIALGLGVGTKPRAPLAVARKAAMAEERAVPRPSVAATRPAPERPPRATGRRKWSRTCPGHP